MIVIKSLSIIGEKPGYKSLPGLEFIWFRVYILIRLPRKEVKSLIKPSDYIGRMHPEDFNNVLREIERLHG